MDPELKKKLQEERKLAKKDEKAKMKLDKKSEKEAKKAAVEARKKDRLKRKDKEEKEAKARRKPGRQGIENCGCYITISAVRRWFFVSTTDGAGIAAVSILDKEHCNWAITSHFSARIFLP